MSRLAYDARVRLRRVAVLAPILGALACASPRPPAAPERTLRLATWNVQNLFDEQVDGAPNETVLSPGQVEAKLARLSGVLRALGADAVALQEVENEAILVRLAAASGGGWGTCLVDGPDPRGIDVAALARARVERCVAHTEDGPLFSRPPLEVHASVGGRRLVLLVAHLVSKVDPASDGRRTEQARRLRTLADALVAREAGALVVIAGDLNDEAGSAPLAPLLADGAWVDVAAGAEPEVTWTYAFQGRHERIDYLLVPRAARARVVTAAAYGARGVRSASDHRPLVVELAW